MIEIENLSVRYPEAPDNAYAIRNLSLAIRAGETVGVIGESGSGKTTLARTLMGLSSPGKVTGVIRYRGVQLDPENSRGFRKFRWRRIAMVFQNAADVLNPVLTVGEQLDEPLRTHFSLSSIARRTLIASLLERVGLTAELLSAYPHELSGGMRQRVLLVMAVSCRPEVLIADEPTSALDPHNRKRMLDVLTDLQKEMGFSLIFITHNLPAVRRMTQRLLTLYAGRLVEAGPTERVLTDPLHGYTRGLIQASPDIQEYKDLWGMTGDSPHAEAIPGCPFHPRCTQSEPECSRECPVLTEVSKGRQVACRKGGIETVLRAEGLTRHYKARSGAGFRLHPVSLSLKSGEIVALVGPSGSGKSTLAHLLAGAEPADAGTRLWKGNQIRGRELTRIPDGIQIVFQDPFASISDRMRIIEAAMEPLVVMKHASPETRREMAENMLRQVGLPETESFVSKPVSTLSGGMRQCLALARALIARPRVLIADEITSMLDPSTQANMLRLLRTLQNRHGFSMLMITHDLHLARKVADRVLVLHQGKLVHTESAVSMFSKTDHDDLTELFYEKVPVTVARAEQQLPVPLYAEG